MSLDTDAHSKGSQLNFLTNNVASLSHTLVVEGPLWLSVDQRWRSFLLSAFVVSQWYFHKSMLVAVEVSNGLLCMVQVSQDPSLPFALCHIPSLLPCSFIKSNYARTTPAWTSKSNCSVASTGSISDATLHQVYLQLKEKETNKYIAFHFALREKKITIATLQTCGLYLLCCLLSVAVVIVSALLLSSFPFTSLMIENRGEQ